MALETGKIVYNLLDSYVETFDYQDSMLDLVTLTTPDGSTMQNAANFVWKNVQQHRSRIQGWDMTGEERGIIQETVPCVLGTPYNDVIQLRADDMRDESYLNNAVKEAAEEQAQGVNSDLTQAIVTQGGLAYRDNSSSAFDFIGIAQAQMNERQLKKGYRNFLLNDRNTLKYTKDLAARQTTQGQPDAVWKSGQLANNIAGFDNVMTGSFLPNIAGGAAATTMTVTGNQSFKPEGGGVADVTGLTDNTDYRSASIVVDDSSKVAVGQKLYFSNSGTPVYAVGKGDKTSTTDPFVVTVIALTDSTHIKVFPKPIAPSSSDTSLTSLEGSYSNIDTQILNAATVTRVNTDTLVKPNIFWEKSAIEVMGGTIPAEKYAEYAGKKVIHKSLKNGLVAYLLYDGDILATTFTCRIFVWYGITVIDPSNCGVAIAY